MIEYCSARAQMFDLHVAFFQIVVRPVLDGLQSEIIRFTPVSTTIATSGKMLRIVRTVSQPLAVRQSNVEQYHVDSARSSRAIAVARRSDNSVVPRNCFDLCQLARNEISIRGTVIDQQHVDFGELVHVESPRFEIDHDRN